MAHVTISDDPATTSRRIIIEIEREFNVSDQNAFIGKALREATEKVAAQWIEENRDKIYERLNAEAIANMILIEVAKQTKDDILEKKNG